MTMKLTVWYIVLIVKRDNEGWTATVVLDNSSSNPVPDDYVRKLYDRVFQGRKDWISVATKVRIYIILHSHATIFFLFRHLLFCHLMRNRLELREQRKGLMWQSKKLLRLVNLPKLLKRKSCKQKRMQSRLVITHCIH